MMKTWCLSLILCLLPLGVQGKEPSPLLSELIEGINTFSLEFYRELADHPGNLVVAPFTLSTVLSLAYVGAREDTLREMASVLHYPVVGDEQLAQGFASLVDRLTTAEGGAYQLQLANAIWLQEGTGLLKPYRALLHRFYGGALNQVNFAAPEQALNTINTWVKAKTDGKVAELLEPDSLSESDRLLITCALYLKASWADPFDPQETKPAPFHLDSKKSTQVEMMRKVQRLPHTREQGMSAVAMPYEGEGERALVLLLLLPDEVDGLRALEQGLTMERVKRLLRGMELKSVDLLLPKFRMATRIYARGLLEQMGMKQAFANDADFSGIDGRKDLRINNVVQEAYIDVDEYGSEAASAAAVQLGLKSLPPEKSEVTFQADHPFLYLLLDAASFQFLFVGRVADPASDL